LSKDEDDKEQSASYVESLDKPVTLMILEWLGFAQNAISMGRYDLAVENTDVAYNFLPTGIKDQVGMRPSSAIDEAISKIPTEDELLNNDEFRQKNPSPRAAAYYRWRMAQQIVRTMVKDYHDRFIRLIDKSGLYVQSAGGGLDIFGDFNKATAGMGFLPAPAPEDQK
jgi:hypothetical protein